LGNLLTVSEAIARSARQRTESRGAHSRLDHPDADDRVWGSRNSVVAKGPDGLMTVFTTPVPAMNEDLHSVLGTEH
jgi:succinate dehydrogenase/fumarate reductase flavoprotein subunit